MALNPIAAIQILSALTGPAPDRNVLRKCLESIPGSHWPQLCRDANHHRVAPLIYETLCTCSSLDLIPETSRLYLERESRGTAAMNMILQHEHSRIACAVSDAGIALLPLKGIHFLSEGLYAPEARPMTDLDYAASGDQIRNISPIMHRLGYEPVASGFSRSFTDRYVREYQYAKTIGGRMVAVEIHDAMIPVLSLRRAFPLPVERLIEQAQITKCGLTPAPAHALLFCILHFAVVHRCSRLLWLSDISRMIHKWIVDWDHFTQETNRACAHAPVYVVLTAARELHGVDAPANRFAAGAGNAGRASAARVRAWLAETASPLERAASPFLLSRTPLRTLAGHLFPPPDFVSLRYGIPGFLTPAWIAARPLLMAANALRSANTRKKIP